LVGCFAFLVEADMYLYPEKLPIMMCIVRYKFVTDIFAGKIGCTIYRKGCFFTKKILSAGEGAKIK